MNQASKRFAYCITVIIPAVVLIVGLKHTAGAQPISAEEVARLEPELCKAGSSSFRALSATLPFLVGSETKEMKPEQIALIDQYKPSGRRKVWVLRLPAAFITEHTCDAGRTNWTGTGDNIQVTQRDRLALIAVGERLIPLTRANTDDLNKGVRIDIYLHNQVRDPDFLHGIYEKGAAFVSSVGVNGPPRCRDVPSDIQGLVIFKRVNPNVRNSMDCEGGHTRGVYAKKISALVYEFVVTCSVNCRVKRDYHGWDVEYFYPFTHLAEWQRLHQLLEKFLDQHTAYMDHDAGNP